MYTSHSKTLLSNCHDPKEIFQTNNKIKKSSKNRFFENKNPKIEKIENRERKSGKRFLAKN